MLRTKQQSDGTMRVQGVFWMKDTNGFPVDMSYEICKENGMDVDWIEALCDALRNDIFKYDQLEREILMLEGKEKHEKIMRMFKLFIMDFEGATIADKASHMHSVIMT